MSPTLLQEIENFLYTHAPNFSFKRELLLLVKAKEDAYVSRILDLEAQDNVGNKMISEGAPSVRNYDPDSWSDLSGTRYDDFE